MSPSHDRTLIDLRSQQLQQTEPLGNGTLLLTLEAIEDGQHGLTPALGPLLVVCERGPRAALAARYLRADGLDAEPWRGTLPELVSALAES